MILSVVNLIFGPLSVIRLMKTRPNYVYSILGGRLMEVELIDESSLGGPKGSCGRLIEVAAKKGSFILAIHRDFDNGPLKRG